MAFKHFGTLNPNGGTMVIGGDGDDGLSGETLGNNSEVLQIGDAVTTDANGDIILCTAGSVVLGILVGVGVNGVAADPDANTLDTFTMTSDNETVAKEYAIIDISPLTLWSASQDGTAGTTANSNKRGAVIDLISENQLDETSADRTRTNGGQFFTWGADPNDTTRLIVSINESEQFAGHPGS